MLLLVFVFVSTYRSSLAFMVYHFLFGVIERWRQCGESVASSNLASLERFYVVETLIADIDNTGSSTSRVVLIQQPSRDYFYGCVDEDCATRIEF